MFKLFLIAIITATLTIGTSHNVHNNKISATTGQQNLPSGDWTVSIKADVLLSYEPKPVLVTSVKSALPDLKVTDVLLVNNSSKEVTTIKLSWILVNKKDPDVVVLKGDSKITNAAPITPTEYIRLKPTDISFSEISKELLKGETHLSGDFIVYIVVSQATYADGTIWSIAKGIDKVQIRPVSNLACVKTGCRYSQQSGYTCVNVDVQTRCINCFYACTDCVCGTQCLEC